MIELTPLESDILNNKSGDKARAALKKTEQDAVKNTELEAAKMADNERQLNVMADDRITDVHQQIAADIAQLIEPLAGYAQAIPTLNKPSLLMHLRHSKQAQAATLQRQELEQAIAGITQRLSDLAAATSGLADNIRQTGQDPETLGKIGILIMDIEVLTGIQQKYAAELDNLLATGFDYGEQGWRESVKIVHETALLDVIKACENCIYEAVGKLYKLDERKFMHFNLSIRAVKGNK